MEIRRSVSGKRKERESEEGAYVYVENDDGNFKKVKLDERDILDSPPLPIEVWSMILGMLDLPSALKLKSVSQMFYSAAMSGQRIQAEDVVYQVDPIRKTTLEGMYLLPCIQDMLFAVDQTRDSMGIQYAYLLVPPYSKDSEILTVPLSSSQPSDRFVPVYLDDTTWIFFSTADPEIGYPVNPSSSVVAKLEFLNMDGTKIPSLAWEEIGSRYRKEDGLSDIPGITTVPENLKKLRIKDLLEDPWYTSPRIFPGVGSMIRYKEFTVLYTLHRVYYLPHSFETEFNVTLYIPNEDLLSSAGRGMLLYQRGSSDPLHGDSIFQGTILQCRHDSGDTRILPIFRLHYPVHVQTLRVACLLNRYILATPIIMNMDLYPTELPGLNPGKIYLYDMQSHQKGRYIHSYRIPKAPIQPIDYLYASGSTIVAFYRGYPIPIPRDSSDQNWDIDLDLHTYHEPWITHAVFYNLVTGVLYIAHIKDWYIANISWTSPEFVYTTPPSLVVGTPDTISVLWYKTLSTRTARLQSSLS